MLRRAPISWQISEETEVLTFSSDEIPSPDRLLHSPNPSTKSSSRPTEPTARVDEERMIAHRGRWHETGHGQVEGMFRGGAEERVSIEKDIPARALPIPSPSTGHSSPNHTQLPPVPTTNLLPFVGVFRPASTKTRAGERWRDREDDRCAVALDASAGERIMKER